MNKLIRDFFINNFNSLTVSTDVKESELRSNRYSQMLDWYIVFAKENKCNCIESDKDILEALNSHKSKIKNFITNGVQNG